MCNMLSNSIAPSLSLPFVTPNLSPPPSSPHVPISVASARVLPATPQLDLSVPHIPVPSASHAFMREGQIFRRDNKPEAQSFGVCQLWPLPCWVGEFTDTYCRLHCQGVVFMAQCSLSLHLAMQEIPFFSASVESFYRTTCPKSHT